MPESIDRRVLGALRCVDRATGSVLTRPFSVSAGNATFIRNRSNLYVIKTASGLETHTETFAQAPSIPSPGSVSVMVRVDDPLNKYLPRTIGINLPRDPNSDNTENDNSLFNPVNVDLYVASNAELMANWSTVRVSVLRGDSSQNLVPVRGRLLRIVRTSDDEVLSSGLSDDRGEALIIVPGVPITQFADDEDNGNQGDGQGEGDEQAGEEPPVIVSELSVRLEVSFDSNQGWPVNPDVLETNHVANLVATETLSLRTRENGKGNY